MIETIDVKQKNLNEKKYIYILLTLAISYLLISPEDIMWAQDRFYYLRYAEFSWTMIQDNISRGLFIFLSNEPLFLLINSIFSIFASPENVVKIIIFLASFLTLYSLGQLSNYNLLLLMFFLFLPTFLLKYITHLRQGLAMSIYFIGLTGTVDNKGFKYIRFLSPFVHSSMMFVILFEFFEAFFTRIKFTSGLRLLISTVAITGTMVFIPRIAMFLGDRRADIYAYEFGLSGSGVGFLIWILVGSYFIMHKNKDYISIICNYGIVFYLVSYLYLDFGARVFESIFPLIVLSAINDKTKWFKFNYVIILILYGLLGWYTRGGINF